VANDKTRLTWRPSRICRSRLAFVWRRSAHSCRSSAISDCCARSRERVQARGGLYTHRFLHGAHDLAKHGLDAEPARVRRGGRRIVLASTRQPERGHDRHGAKRRRRERGAERCVTARAIRSAGGGVSGLGSPARAAPCLIPRQQVPRWFPSAVRAGRMASAFHCPK
jgi:hypothetical protein